MSEMAGELGQDASAGAEKVPRTAPIVVGIGASTANIDALVRLLAQLPDDAGLAYAVVLRGAPRPLDGSFDLRTNARRMSIVEAVDGMAVDPNHVYVIGGDRHMAWWDGVLHEMKPLVGRDLRLPIDYFFRSLAHNLGAHSIGIILPGVGLDGALGLQAIKAQGGLTLAQTPVSEGNEDILVDANHLDIVDVIASPDQLSARLINYIFRPSNPWAKKQGGPEASIDEEAMERILVRIRQHTGHDFAGYKENTITRRIERRMGIHHVNHLDEYVRILDRSPGELDALFQELLIGVTSFFRDPEAFACLEKMVVRPLFAKHFDSGLPIRVWVPGCSTGEEAYSIAILLHEQASRFRKPVDFKIFATDIDTIALNKARNGRYPASIEGDIDPDRFQKFFVRDKSQHTVVVGAQLRDSVIFAAQSIVKDPPFSKLDLICCRNLMIYLGAEMQKRIFPVFHFALNPDGYLFLGNSETLGTSQRFFHTLDHKWKIYQRLNQRPDVSPHFSFHRPPMSTLATREMPTADTRHSLRQMTEQVLLAEYTPTAIVVGESGHMLYVHGRTGKFLEQTTGEISSNLIKIARDGLRMPLITALRQVATDRKRYQCDGIAIQHEQETIHVRLTAAPMSKSEPGQGLILVTLTEIAPPTRRNQDDDHQNEQSIRVDELQLELNSTREYLHATIAQLERANEEHKAGNDELQSANEELQSTNEELQTSKEELQSVNEELSTLNTELQQKITELIDANNDIKNLLDNAQIGIIFLDSEFCIRRFTRSIANIVDLIPSDMGRPMAQFAHRLRYDHLLEDARRVFETQRPQELDIRSTDNRWYLVRILPYRTIEDQVDGVVLTFTDITALKDSKEKLEFMFDVLPVGVTILDRERKSVKHNAAYLRMSDLSAEEVARGRQLKRKYFRPDGSERLMEEFAVSRVINGESSALGVESGFLRQDGTTTWLEVSAVACPFPDWSVLTVTADVTARKEAEIALHDSEKKFSNIFRLAPMMMAIIDLTTYTFVDCNQRFLDVSGFTREEVIGRSPRLLGWVPVETGEKLMRIIRENGFAQNEEVICRTKDGRYIDCLYHGFSMNVGGHEKIVSMLQDISERKRSEEAIKATLRQEKETVLRELAHRTKNNMFVIRSMLNLHAMHTQNEEVIRLFADVENKIVAMALVHQKLYQSKNLSRLDLGEYLQELAPALLDSLSLTPGRVRVNVAAEPISALIDTAIPCGLVVTELVSNAFKHAFPHGRPGQVTIRLFRKVPNLICLEVSDDGIGIASDFDFRHQPSLGLQTIFMIVEHQLNGSVQFHPTPQGLTCHIEFADSLYSERV